MDNICELLINFVSASKPKMLTGLNQKVRGMVRAFGFRSAQSMIPPEDRQILSHQGYIQCRFLKGGGVLN
ncbi:hypothetical protein DENIS_2342 [Desulfonema ishimotonii]|uniref:Uncharacterized protein n=1 Tax=Desulfonema ishimotonii TaxID=45657 RepID=A0A401FWK0_9BACT|nr:hypothetical protein DENIS_2342 [Desulfonema ishimotonii]